MPHARALRHASLLLLLGALLLLGVVHENTFDSGDGAYADDIREQRDGGVPLHVLFHSPAYWRAVPLSLDRSVYPYVTDAFVKEFIQRTSPPQLADVVDNRTLLSPDFYEELQLLRVPGVTAAQVAEAVRAQREAERTTARAAAVKQRHSKSWKTRRPSPPSLLSRLWPSFLSVKANGFSSGRDGSDTQDFVEVQYASNILYHGKSGAARQNNDDKDAKYQRGTHTAHEAVVGDGGTVAAVAAAATSVIHRAVSLETDAVQLVPFPFVPHDSVVVNSTPAKSTINAAADGGEEITVRIGKGRLRHAVPHRTTPHPPTHGWDHFYIALNLWKNEGVIPDLTEALVVFLEDEVKPFFPLATSVVVSIYASISPDRTAELIESILIPRLHAIGVRVVYATTEGSCLGYVERRAFHERIEWMACIRNRALAPLYEHGMGVFLRSTRRGDADPAAEQVQTRTDVDAPHSSSEGLVVLFFNDIFFRPQDVVTLLESRTEAKALQRVRPHGWLESVTPAQRSTSSTTAAHQQPQQQQRHQTEAAAGAAGAAVAASARGTTFDMACGMDFYYTFYDTWVTRDRLGKPFEAQMPYSDDHATQEAFYRIFNHDLGERRKPGTTTAAPLRPETAAVPVKCCWNGVSAIRGRFFLPPTPQHRQGFPQAAVAAALLEHTTQVRQPMNWTHREGNNSQHPRGEEYSTPPRIVERPSGAVYDLLGTVQDVVDTVGLEDYFTRVLTRRLQSERAAWNSTRGEIAELTGHPFYQPTVYDNMSTFTTLLGAVLEQRAHNTSGLPASLVTAFEGEVALAATRRSSDPGAPAADARLVDDSVYYVARHPAVRFRHAFTPSYGATVHGLKPVRDDVCLSSECLLICQDIMQAAILQDQRVPVILLNPHVRVAYDLDHFQRITRHTWFFEHPYVYWTWVMARRVQLWWSTGSTSGGSSGEGFAGSATAAVGTLQSAEVRELGKATSATDDWLRSSPAPSPAPPAHPTPSTGPGHPPAAAQLTLRWEDGGGDVIDVGVTDIATLTWMTCQRITAGSISLAVGAFFPLLRVCQLLVVALLLRWMCWDTQAAVARKLQRISGSPGRGGTSHTRRLDPFSSSEVATAGQGEALTVEEKWWCTTYSAIWCNPVARRVRSWVDVLAVAGGGGAAAGGGDSGGGGGGLFDRRKTTATLPPVPLLHLQLRRYYRRRKVAATLGTCAHTSRRVLQAVARVVLWLLGTLCCVRCWCGCRVPQPPPAPSCCGDTRCGELWDAWVAKAPAVEPSRRSEQNCAAWSHTSIEKSSRGRGTDVWHRFGDGSPLSLTHGVSDGRNSSRHSSFECSVASTSPAGGAFRESGDEMERWPGWLLQQQQHTPPPPPFRRPLVVLRQVPEAPTTPTPESPHPQVYAGSPAGASITNPLMSPSVAASTVARADSPAILSLMRSDVVPQGGVGGILQSVRPRNSGARGFTSHATHSPTSPSSGFPCGVRPGDVAVAGDASIQSI
jgi:hypothetical protein